MLSPCYIAATAVVTPNPHTGEYEVVTGYWVLCRLLNTAHMITDRDRTKALCVCVCVCVCHELNIEPIQVRRSYCMNELLWMRLVMSFPWFIHSQATAVWQCVWACVYGYLRLKSSSRLTDLSVARQCCISQPVTSQLLCRALWLCRAISSALGQGHRMFSRERDIVMIDDGPWDRKMHWATGTEPPIKRDGLFKTARYVFSVESSDRWLIHCTWSISQTGNMY